MRLLLALLFLLNGKAYAFSDSSTASRFRPQLEVPSFYLLSKKQKSFIDSNISIHEQLTELMKVSYTELDAQTFNQPHFLEKLVSLAAREQGECKIGEDSEIRKCQIRAVDLSLAILRSDQLIDDVAYRVVWNAVTKNDWAAADPTSSLQKYWNKLRQLGDLKPSPFNLNPYQSNRFNSKFQGEKISARQRLFLKFSFLEINAMGKLIETWLIRTNSGMAVAIDYNHDGVDDERIPLSEGEVEVEATKLYNRLKARARAGVLVPDSERDASSYLNQLGFSDTDILLASIETGRVPMNVIELLSKDPRINDPAHPTRDKILSIGKQVLMGAALATPIISAYSAVALVVWKTFQQVRIEKKKVSDDIL